MVNVQNEIKKKSQTYSEIDMFSFWQCAASLLFALSFIIQEWHLFFLFVGIFNLVLAVYYIRISMLTKSWKKVQGQYQLFRLDTVTIQRCRLGGIDVRYRPYCMYSYRLDDISYSSDRLAIVKKDYELISATGNDLKSIIKRDIATKTIDLFVNPDDYSESILVREISKWKLLRVYFIGLLGLLETVFISVRLLY